MIPYGHQTISDEDIAAVVRVLKGEFLTQGESVPAFEKMLATYCKASHVIACCNGTAALHLACCALEIGADDIVWVPAISFVATANCARYCNATVDFVDIDPYTGNISLLALNEKLTEAKAKNRLPRLLIVVHLAGQPCDLAPIAALCGQYGIALIEDACHALGASYRGSPIGQSRYSDMTIFSFHPVKPITTGEGGAITTENATLAAKLRLYRSHGITRDRALFKQPSSPFWYYEQQHLGFNYRLTDIQAALGVSQLTRLDHFISQRQQLAQRYDQLLTPLPIEPLKKSNDSHHGYHLYVIQCEQRDRVIAQLHQAEIGVNVHYIPIPAHPYYQQLGHQVDRYPGALHYYQRAITLPLYPDLCVKEQDYIVDTLTEALCS